MSGWAQLSLGGPPTIVALSNTESPAGATVLIAVTGLNFFTYSTVRFADLSPTTFFINSNLLEFYVPRSLVPGRYPLQVFNDTRGSNIVSFPLMTATNFFQLSVSTGNIENTNPSGLVRVHALARTLSWLPASATVSTTPYVVESSDTFVLTPVSSTAFYVSLPQSSGVDASSLAALEGREITFKTFGAAIYTAVGQISAASIKVVVSLTSPTASSTILPAVPGAWVTLVFSQNYWFAVQGSSSSSSSTG